MNRLTTDKPEGNVENLLNLFYIKDQWTWVRGGGPAPDYKDVSLCDLVRMMVKANIPDTELPKDDNNLSMMMMHEWLMDESDTAEGIIALLYNAGWAFAELRLRLAYYEEMEEQGRLVVLPCKMGMAAWSAVGGRVIEISVTGIKAGAAGRIYTADLDCESGCSIEECDGCEVYEWYDAHRGNEGEVELTEEDFGKTVFFDREEAEKALEQERGGTHEDS